MLTATRQSDGAKVAARDAERADAPFGCIGCAADMTLKKGSLRVHHFAHKATAPCRAGRGETEDHLRVKHYAPVSLHVPQQTWRKAGRDLSAGGYDRRSRLWVRPHAGEPVSLSAHFQRRVRPAWSGGKLVVPDCTLFIDRQPPWWD